MFPSGSQYQLSRNQQDLLVAALASNQPSGLKKTQDNTAVMDHPEKRDAGVSAQQNGYQKSTNDYFSQPPVVSPDQFLDDDDSPYLGFDVDADGDDQFDFSNNGQLMGGFPGDD